MKCILCKTYTVILQLFVVYRSRTLMQSSDNLPCSLILLCDKTVVGHIRLLRVIGEEKTVFLTSGEQHMML